MNKKINVIIYCVLVISSTDPIFRGLKVAHYFRSPLDGKLLGPFSTESIARNRLIDIVFANDIEEEINIEVGK